MTNQVFVSSTFTDLKGHRAAAREVIQKLGARDIAMETFGARDERPLAECLRIIKSDSDLFVGIYAHRYGFIPDGKKISMTEAEYVAATEKGLPRLIFVVNDEAPWNPKFIDDGPSKRMLQKFLTQLKANHIVEHFDSEKDLASRVASSVGREISLQNLRRVSGVQVDQVTGKIPTKIPKTGKDWSRLRDGIYADTRRICLAHTFRPSRKSGQQFDTLVYLVRHKPGDPEQPLDDVAGAEFFFGRYWGSKIFRVKNDKGFVGLSTAAYGPFLCVCKVQFTDGESIVIHRYIDFESAKVAR